MIFGSLLVLTTLITLTDIVSAWLFSGSPEHWGITAIRVARDGLTLILATWGGLQAYRNGTVFMLAALYLGGIVLYLLLTGSDIDFTIAAGSAARLALPVTLMAAGYGGIRSAEQMTAYALTLAGLACASTLFGIWDINHTEFWTETLEYGHYLNGVKGIVTGFDYYYVLPFNFFGFEDQRRAAGLVAAPLAQGSFVAIGCLFGFAVLYYRSLFLASAILLTGLYGIWQSGTRGAMLMIAIALPMYLLLIAQKSGLKRNAILLLGLAFISFEAIAYTVSYSVNLEDGSTIGHVDALAKNIEDIDQALLAGSGVGAAGSVAADNGLEVAGGGEGAIFSIIYQIGLPGAVLFLALCGLALKHLYIHARQVMEETGQAPLGLTVFCLGFGLIPTLISSDHILSLSAVGVFWIAFGGALSLADQARKGIRR